MALIDGDDAVLDDPLPYTIYNKNKNHWYGAAAPANPQNGMIWVKNDGSSYLYHNAAWIGIGRICQIIIDTDDAASTKGTGFPADNTIPQRAEGDEILSCAITPKHASSTILIFYTVHVRGTVAWALAGLFISSSNDALQITFSTVVTINPMTTIYSEAAASVVARTYSVRVGDSTGNNCEVNNTSGPLFGVVEKSRLIVMEVSP